MTDTRNKTLLRPAGAKSRRMTPATNPQLVLPAGRTLALTPPVIMGVLNITPDSFSDAGAYMDPAVALRQGRTLIAQGAGIIDIGGESTRPGSDAVTPAEQIGSRASYGD